MSKLSNFSIRDILSTSSVQMSTTINIINSKSGNKTSTCNYNIGCFDFKYLSNIFSHEQQKSFELYFINSMPCSFNSLLVENIAI